MTKNMKSGAKEKIKEKISLPITHIYSDSYLK